MLTLFLLDGVRQTHPQIYSLRWFAFCDVTKGTDTMASDHAHPARRWLRLKPAISSLPNVWNEQKQHGFQEEVSNTGLSVVFENIKDVNGRLKVQDAHTSKKCIQCKLPFL